VAEITKTLVTTAVNVFRVEVRVASPSIIDPIAFVSSDSVLEEILSRAGLSEDLLFISAKTLRSGVVGDNHFWDVQVSFDSTEIDATGHRHDSSTVSHPLEEAYLDGASIDIAGGTGPVLITGDGDTEMLTIKDSSGNLFRVPADGDLRIGKHLKWEGDKQYDIGSSDGGTSFRRPRDIYVGQAVKAEQAIIDTAEAKQYLFDQQLAVPDVTTGVRYLYWNQNDNSLRSWNGTTETILVGATGEIGSPARAFIGTPGNSSLETGDRVEWTKSQIQGSLITLSGGTGQQRGIVTLVAGHTYRIGIGLDISFDSPGAYIEIQVFDITQSAKLITDGGVTDPTMTFFGTESTKENVSLPVIHFEFTPTVDTQYDVRFEAPGGGGVLDFISASSWMTIDALD
jgi:hypothetical protein